jgi:hypothetical protein
VEEGIVTTLAAGRELDALIAEKVMGWTDCRLDDREDETQSRWFVPTGITPSGRVAVIAHYSTDISAAWLVVERLRATGTRGWDIGLDTADHDEWLCQVWDDPEDNFIGSATASTAPLAICRAALAAVEAK